MELVERFSLNENMSQRGQLVESKIQLNKLDPLVLLGNYIDREEQAGC